jgi:hypothetical protein
MVDEFKKVEIHWRDATSYRGWHARDTLEDIVSQSPGLMRTTGWKVGENETHVFICGTVGELKIENILAIPKVAIVEQE